MNHRISIKTMNFWATKGSICERSTRSSIRKDTFAIVNEYNYFLDLNMLINRYGLPFHNQFDSILDVMKNTISERSGVRILTTLTCRRVDGS